MCVWITRALPAIVQTLSGVGEGAQPAQAPARALPAAPRATGSSSAACPERPPSHERWEPRRPLCSRPGTAPYRLPPHRRRRGAGRPSPPSYGRCPDRDPNPYTFPSRCSPAASSGSPGTVPAAAPRWRLRGGGWRRLAAGAAVGGSGCARGCARGRSAACALTARGPRRRRGPGLGRGAQAPAAPAPNQ